MDALRAQATPPVVIGLLEPASRESASWAPKAFHEGMAALGWKLDVQYRLEERYTDGRVERLRALAQEIAATKPAVILAGLTAATKAIAAAAPTTPIVQYNGNPMASGFVASLARPGGLVTGVSNVAADTQKKVIELLVEALPKIRQVGFLIDSSATNHGAVVTASRQMAEHFRIEPVIVSMAKPEDIEPAFVELTKAKVQALVLLPSTWFASHMPTIMAKAMAQRLPAVGVQAGIPRHGGLFSYGHSASAGARRSAHHVDRILKGAKPGELPIELPTTFDMVLNLKTARQLGIVLPQSVLLRATEVIE
jgi:putative tryptophan/tyrosine transport system substrate-binding protein